MIAALFSGGKDSTLAIHRMYDVGVKTDLLITMVSENDFSYMFHKPNIKYSELQAQALGIKQVLSNTLGEKEKELIDLERVLVANDVDVLITGAVASTYQKERIENICDRLSIKCHSPLWHIQPLVELKELSCNYNVIVTQIAAEGMDESMLGHRIDDEMIKRLEQIHERHGINMLFEGGEAESFVLDAPLFRKKIVVESASVKSSGQVGQYIIDKAVLAEK